MNAPHVGLPLKLLLSYVLVGVLLAAPPFFILRRTLFATLVDTETQRLLDRARSLRGSLQKVPEANLPTQVHALGSLVGDRITMVNRAGQVVADSELSDPELARVENHADRPEIQAAWATGLGSSVRFSATLKRDLIYVAIPLEDTAPNYVLRLASPKTALSAPVDRVLVALRFSAGAGISAALLLSLVAAAVVSRPLRRMRDAAREFARSNWVEIPPIRTGDELQELSVALAELGRQMRLQLVTLGANEAMLVQVLERLDSPAAVVRADGSLVHLNGRFREALKLPPEREETELVVLVKELGHTRASDPDSETYIWKHAPLGVPIQAWSLARPAQEPWWLMLTPLGGREESDEDAIGRQLRSLDGLVQASWADTPADQKPRLAKIRSGLDDLMRAMSLGPDGSVTSCPASQLVGQSVEQVLTDPALHDRVGMAELPSVALAECGGLASLLVRQVVRGAASTLRNGDRVRLSCEVEASRVRLRIQGGTPTLQWAANVPRGLGAELELDPVDQEVAWLNLPRA